MGVFSYTFSVLIESLKLRNLEVVVEPLTLNIIHTALVAILLTVLYSLVSKRVNTSSPPFNHFTR
jgi:hypothetical protein